MSDKNLKKDILEVSLIDKQLCFFLIKKLSPYLCFIQINLIGTILAGLFVSLYIFLDSFSAYSVVLIGLNNAKDVPYQ